MSARVCGGSAVAGRRLERQRRGLVPVEGDALDELLVPVLFGRRARRDGDAGGGQLLERDVERQRTQAVVGALLEAEGDGGNDLVAPVDDTGVVIAGDGIDDLERLLQVDGLRTPRRDQRGEEHGGRQSSHGAILAHGRAAVRVARIRGS